MKIEFKFKEGQDDKSRANSMMMHLVNRGAEFNRERYDQIALELDNSAQSVLLYMFSEIMANFRGVTVYLKGREQPSFVTKKHPFVKAVPRKKKWEKILASDSTLHFTPDTSVVEIGKPYFFAGYSDEVVKFIAKHLYGWEG